MKRNGTTYRRTLIHFLSLFMVFCLAGMVPAVCSAEQAPAVQPKADKPPLDASLLEPFKAQIEITFIIPRPAVIQSVLEAHQFSFTGEVKPNFTDSYKESSKIALNLGARCTDGIMMVYGDKTVATEDMEKLGAVILKLAGELGLVDELEEIDAFKAALKSKDQAEIKSRIDKLFAEVEELLRKKDQNLRAMTVSLGGWISLMYYAADELVRNYQPESSKVLAMDYIVEVYMETLQRLEPMVKDSPALSAIAAKLPELKELMHNPEDKPLSPEAVRKIQAIAANLKQEIEKP